MNATIAVQMTGADLLKLRKKRGILIWALVLTLAPLLIYFIVAAAQHSSDPVKHSAAGGTHGFIEVLPVLALIFGPLAAILIGAEAGAGDANSGVFRDLVVTGRARVGLFASRVPAALTLCWLVIGSGYLLLAIGTYAFASGEPTPDAALIVNGLLFSLLSTGVLCVVAVGFASLTTSRPATITALIGWQLVASPILVAIDSLGNAREVILSQAIGRFSPVHIDSGGHGVNVTMSSALAFLVLVGWLAVFLALGAWRTNAMDA